MKTPHYGAHIKSYMGKLAEEFRTLPGATFSNPTARGKHDDSEEESAIGFHTFSLWLANHICCIYHYRPHSGLNGLSPIEQWEKAMYEGTETQAPRRKIPARFLGEQAERLQLDFLPYEERIVSEEGVRIDKVHYMRDTLRRWINAKDPDFPKRKRQFTFRRDPRDISLIYFWNPELNQYEVIPYRDPTRPPATLWELRAARERLRVKRELPDGKHTEAMIFEAIRRNRDLVEAAVVQKKKSRRRGGCVPASMRAASSPRLRRW